MIPFLVNERRKTKRFEVGIGKPNREGLGACEIPRAKSAASGITRPAWDGPRVLTELRGDDAEFSTAATKQPEVANGPSG